MNKKLLFSITKNDFEMQVFRAGGKGGQKQNKTSSGVRIIHKQSGARGESREERHQIQNKKNAFNRCINTDVFQKWLKIKTATMFKNEIDINEKVDRLMCDDNIKIEVRKNDKWINE